ncbi:MAG: hypothetical protein FWD48_11820, partial [Oscillospiraceae bacterium]|nr:hypothetical protein [Oscillospiraceae bacterium]
MIDSLQAQISDWKYGRGIIKNFITMLNDSDLDKPLPRKNLNTIRKQCEELVQIQSCYVKALEDKQIKFSYSPLDNVSKEGLISQMNELDTILEAQLEQFTGCEKIVWFGDEWNIHQHISAMIGHEQMHIGQIIAFCYATGIDIPD